MQSRGARTMTSSDVPLQRVDEGGKTRNELIQDALKRVGTRSTQNVYVIPLCLLPFPGRGLLYGWKRASTRPTVAISYTHRQHPSATRRGLHLGQALEDTFVPFRSARQCSSMTSPLLRAFQPAFLVSPLRHSHRPLIHAHFAMYPFSTFPSPPTFPPVKNWMVIMG